ncbi:MAG: hypothetical protein KAT68_00090 [Bacteroidales bacterium]|nr:hypothetical protein [Bacteroidales bacterium]
MDELSKIAPKLSKIKKDNPFKAPDGYFDNFPLKMQEIITAQKEVVKPKFVLFAKPQLAYIYAFSLIIVMVFSYTVMTNYFNNNANQLLTSDEICEIIEYDVYEYDEALFVDALLDDDYDISDSDNDASEEIIDYLLDDNIDYNTIIEEL